MFEPSSLIGKFKMLRWEQWDFDFDYIVAQMYYQLKGRKTGGQMCALLNINVDQIILNKLNSGIQIFLNVPPLTLDSHFSSGEKCVSPNVYLGAPVFKVSGYKWITPWGKQRKTGIFKETARTPPKPEKMKKPQ